VRFRNLTISSRLSSARITSSSRNVRGDPSVTLLMVTPSCAQRIVHCRRYIWNRWWGSRIITRRSPIATIRQSSARIFLSMDTVNMAQIVSTHMGRRSCAILTTLLSRVSSNRITWPTWRILRPLWLSHRRRPARLWSRSWRMRRTSYSIALQKLFRTTRVAALS